MNVQTWENLDSEGKNEETVWHGLLYQMTDVHTDVIH